MPCVLFYIPERLVLNYFPDLISALKKKKKTLKKREHVPGAALTAFWVKALTILLKWPDYESVPPPSFPTGSNLFIVTVPLPYLQHSKFSIILDMGPQWSDFLIFINTLQRQFEKRNVQKNNKILLQTLKPSDLYNKLRLNYSSLLMKSILPRLLLGEGETCLYKTVFLVAYKMKVLSNESGS